MSVGSSDFEVQDHDQYHDRYHASRQLLIFNRAYQWEEYLIAEMMGLHAQNSKSKLSVEPFSEGARFFQDLFLKFGPRPQGHKKDMDG